MIWRRILLRSDQTIADLHYTIQIAMGWSDSHLNRFHIHGKDYGVAHEGGIWFDDNPEKVYYLAGFGLGVALLDLHFLGMRELRGCESPYDFSSFLTIFSLPRGLGRGEEATDGTVSGTR